MAKDLDALGLGVICQALGLEFRSYYIAVVFLLHIITVMVFIGE